MTVAYDTAKGRTTKTFDDAVGAKQWYAKQFKDGKNPKVIGDEPAPATERPAEPPAKAPRVRKPCPAASDTGDAAETTEKTAEAKPAQ